MNAKLSPEEVKYYRIEMSADFLTELLEQGWYLEKVECLKGLPRGCILLDANIDHTRGTVHFLFRNPKIAVESEKQIETIYRKHYGGDRILTLNQGAPAGSTIVVHRQGFVTSDIPDIEDRLDTLADTIPLEYEAEQLT